MVVVGCSLVIVVPHPRHPLFHKDRKGGDLFLFTHLTVERRPFSSPPSPIRWLHVHVRMYELACHVAASVWGFLCLRFGIWHLSNSLFIYLFIYPLPSQRHEGFSHTATKGTRPPPHKAPKLGIPPGAVSPLCVAVRRGTLSCAVRASGGGVECPSSLRWDLSVPSPGVGVEPLPYHPGGTSGCWK